MKRSFFNQLIRSWVRAWLGLVPPKPKPVKLGTVKVLTVLRYTFALPPVPAIDDFDHREANVTVGSAEPQVVVLTSGQTEFQQDFDRDVEVSITLVDVDTSNNKSDPSEALEFTTTDTVPPPAPGGLTVSNIQQV